MIIVLRLGHRLKRDGRLSTHVGLVARAMGADKIIYAGDKDDKLLGSINDVSERFGGSFKAIYESRWKKIMNDYKKKKYCIVHLTMYGMPLKNKISKIKKSKKVLVIVGSEKVPSEVYHLADYNISVTNQPHSEVAALAIFLKEISGKKEKKFSKAKLRIIPQERGKKVISKRKIMEVQ